MKPMQEELLVNDLTERLAAIKRVKNSLSKIRAPFVSGFGKTASKNGKGKKTEKEPSIATIKPVFKDKDGYSSILHENGVVRINNVMPLSTTQALYSWICEEKIASEKSIAEGMIDSQSRFTNALLKKNRWDLLLPLEDSAVVMKGLYDTLVANDLLSSIISSRFGMSAELYEVRLHCFVSVLFPCLQSSCFQFFCIFANISLCFLFAPLFSSYLWDL